MKAINEKTLLDILQCRKSNKRMPVQRGCTTTSDFGGCYCDGRCKDIIGYYENGVYTKIEENELQQTKKNNSFGNYNS